MLVATRVRPAKGAPSSPRCHVAGIDDGPEGARLGGQEQGLDGCYRGGGRNGFLQDLPEWQNQSKDTTSQEGPEWRTSRSRCVGGISVLAPDTVARLGLGEEGIYRLCRL